jgi:hypothetical protein
MHAVGDLDGVGSRLALNGDEHSALVVKPGEKLVIIDAIDDVGDFF